MAARLPRTRASSRPISTSRCSNHAAARQPKGRPITWQQADALALPFEDRSFDAVACQFGAMFFPDKVQGYREARRVLKPGGRFFFNVWDRIEDNEFADVVTQALAAMFPHDPPRFMARTPHGYHDVEKIRERSYSRGFFRVSIEAVRDALFSPAPVHAGDGGVFVLVGGTPLRNDTDRADDVALVVQRQHAAAAPG